MRSLGLILLFCACAFCGNCEDEGLSMKELTVAKKVYTSKCGRCHEFYEPSAYSDKEWNLWMTKMIRKSRLKKEQAELVLRYTNHLHAKPKQAQMKN